MAIAGVIVGLALVAYVLGLAWERRIARLARHNREIEAREIEAPEDVDVRALMRCPSCGNEHATEAHAVRRARDLASPAGQRMGAFEWVRRACWRSIDGACASNFQPRAPAVPLPVVQAPSIALGDLKCTTCIHCLPSRGTRPGWCRHPDYMPTTVDREELPRPKWCPEVKRPRA